MVGPIVVHALDGDSHHILLVLFDNKLTSELRLKVD